MIGPAKGMNSSTPASRPSVNAEGIPSAVYYRKPLHRQPAYAQYPCAGNGLPVCEKLGGEVISLPMHAYLAASDQDRIIAAVRKALR